MSLPSSPSLSSRRASRSSHPQRTSLTLDLSCIPPLTQPSPPSNTLLITDLHDLRLFQPNSLAEIKSRIAAVAPLNSFSPLPSFRRIVCSFTSIEAAIQIRQLLDGGEILGKNVRAKVFFGEHTPVEDAEVARKKKLLEAPQSQKMFFISPPPSPPHGWQMRNEDPPNKEVHAADLAEALNKLGTMEGTVHSPSDDGSFPETPISISEGQDGMKAQTSTSRQRSGSTTIIYDPQDHGRSPDLPAVMVEDTSMVGSDAEISPIEEPPAKRIMAHTPRPPVELMH